MVHPGPSTVLWDPLATDISQFKKAGADSHSTLAQAQMDPSPTAFPTLPGQYEGDSAELWGTGEGEKVEKVGPIKVCLPRISDHPSWFM